MSGGITRRELVMNAAVVGAGLAARGAAGAEEKLIGERIRRIETGLIVRSPLRDFPARAAPLAERMAHFKVPGLGIALIHNYQVEWARSYGARELGGATPITNDTLFQAGSISKPVAAAGALRLVEAGKLDLDEDVNRYLTSWKVPANAGWQPRITIRQIVSHTAGLTVHGFPGYPRDHKAPSLVQILEGRPPSNTPAILVDTVPGTQMRYSGGGYCVLQQLMIDVLKKPFPEAMRELVLDPCGMTSSSYEQPLPPARARFAATGHYSDGQQVHGRAHVYPEMAAAGLWTTPTDLARFAIELQLARAGKPSKLLSEGMAKQMMTPQVEDHIGLGVFLSGKGESARFGHGGWDEGFVCEMTVYQQSGRGAVVMANSDAGASRLNPEILRSIASEYGWPGYLPAGRTSVKIEPAAVERFAGKYELRPGFQLAVKKKGAGLALEVPGQPPMELLAESENKFYPTVTNAEITFNLKENGDVTGLSFRQNGRDMPARRS